MSYSLSIPDVAVEIDREELRARVLDTAAAVGFTDIPEHKAMLGRMVDSAECAMMLVNEVMELTDGAVNIMLSGHISSGVNDWDTCNISIGRNPK